MKADIIASESSSPSWAIWIAKTFDSRVSGRCDHLLIDILVITFCALLCGAESLVEIEKFGKAKIQWFREKLHLKLPSDIPSHDTIGRVLNLITPKNLEWIFFEWVRILKESKTKHIAFDGKTIQGTDRTFNQGNRPVHLVSAFCTETGVVLGQRSSKSSGTSENKAILECIEHLDLTKTLVTFDAASSWPRVFKAIREKKGSYLAPVKKNLRIAWNEINPFFENLPTEVNLLENEKVVKDVAETIEKNRDRGERRICTVVDIESLPQEMRETLTKRIDPKIRSIIRMERYREVADTRFSVQLTGTDGKQSYHVNKNLNKKKVSRTIVYYISNESKSASWFMARMRRHWKIESQLHWKLDVAFGEDDWRVRNKKAARNLATLRKMAFNLLQKDPSKGSLKSKIKRASWDPDFLDKVIFQVPSF